MPVELDHLILQVGDVARSIEFYDAVLGLRREADGLSMTKPEFDCAFARIVAAAIPHCDRFDTVGSKNGPSDERGARGDGQSPYYESCT